MFVEPKRKRRAPRLFWSSLRGDCTTLHVLTRGLLPLVWLYYLRDTVEELLLCVRLNYSLGTGKPRQSMAELDQYVMRDVAKAKYESLS